MTGNPFDLWKLAADEARELEEKLFNANIDAARGQLKDRTAIAELEQRVQAARRRADALLNQAMQQTGVRDSDFSRLR